MTADPYGARPVPELARPRRPRLPTVAERMLPNGLRAVVVRRPSVPLVQLRLRVPFAGRRPDHLAKSKLLERTMLLGTARRSTSDLAIALQEIGGGVRVSTDPDRLSVRGEALRSGLPRLLGLLGEVLDEASYPREAVAGEAGRLQDQLRRSWSQPGVVAGEALLRRMYDGHPYARELPHPEEVAPVTAAAVRALHRGRVAPDGSVLVLVGDVSPARALDAVESALSAWDRTARAPHVAPPPAPEQGPLTLVDRPGAVQSNLRLGGPALPRSDSGYAALMLANLVFGGYFASRLVMNIREDKGYTYSPHSRLHHASASSALVLDADVATEVTAPALVEIGYELGRIATLPVTEDELRSAQRYATGTLALSTATQAGLATTLEELLADGLDVSWLREQPERLARVGVEEVQEQAHRFLAPAGLVGVVVGDGARVERPLRALTDVAAAPA